MPADATFIFRPMLAHDLHQAEAMTRAVSWPHRAEDWRFVLDLGFGHVAAQNGTLAATAMGWPQGPAAASLGMIIVSPEAQGAGLGRRITETVLHALGPVSIELHATAAGLPLYEKLGFTRQGAISQHQGLATPRPPPDAAIRPATPADLPALAALDRHATGADRTHILAALLAIGQTVILERHNTQAGFATLRRFGRGHQIGPVIAPDPQAAQALLHHFIHHHPGRVLRADIVAASTLAPFLAACGLAHAGGATLMRRGPPRPTPTTTHRFALINQALG